jgi:hypothetical protein
VERSRGTKLLSAHRGMLGMSSDRCAGLPLVVWAVGAEGEVVEESENEA